MTVAPEDQSAAPERQRPGRKPLPPGTGKLARVDLRVHAETKAAWQAKAKAAGLKLQTWIERELGRAK